MSCMPVPANSAKTAACSDNSMQHLHDVDIALCSNSVMWQLQPAAAATAEFVTGCLTLVFASVAVHPSNTRQHFPACHMLTRRVETAHDKT